VSPAANLGGAGLASSFGRAGETALAGRRRAPDRPRTLASDETRWPSECEDLESESKAA
jgi:hypothetical protein